MAICPLMLMKEKIAMGDAVASQSTEDVDDEDGSPRLPEEALALTMGLIFDSVTSTILKCV